MLKLQVQGLEYVIEFVYIRFKLNLVALQILFHYEACM